MKKIVRHAIKTSIAIVSILSLAGYGNASDSTQEMSGENITVTVSSNIVGMADTGNKTTLKQELVKEDGPGDTNLYYYDEEGNRVVYEDQEETTYYPQPVSYSGEAVISLSEVTDDSKIDCSDATVELIDGSRYYADEFILSNTASKLSGQWINGTYTYTLSEGDLEWDNTGYDATGTNSGREWSMMGGDGNGVYHFNFQVSGIKYDGQEIDAAVFPVTVYIYGRSSADLGLSKEFVENTYSEDYKSGKSQTEEIQWTWFTDGEESMADKPYMNDEYTDYFSITWPEGTDASSVTASDVTVTLSSEFGEEYTLQNLNAYGETEYAVKANADETEIFVTYQQWAFYPVYSKLTITVDNGVLNATNTYEIASVLADFVQTGGGGIEVDGTTTCYSFYGINGMTVDNAYDHYYTLSTTIDGVNYYYVEDESGNGSLEEAITEENFGMTVYTAPANAVKYDATDLYNISVKHNTIFVESRTGDDATETKTVDGEEIVFTRNIGSYKRASEMIESGATLEAGYNLTSAGADKWSWSMRYQSGWTTLTPQPTGLPYAEQNYPYGYMADSQNEAYTAIANGTPDSGTK